MIYVNKEDIGVKGKQVDVLAELAYLINNLLEDIEEEFIDYSIELGKKDRKEEKHELEVKEYHINAKDKKEAMKQIKALKLPKHVEKACIEHILN